MERRELLELLAMAAGSAAAGAALQPGVAGAAESTADRPPGQDVINVRSLGAVGDGRTDDTAAIQAAIHAATGRDPRRHVYFPPGRYVITSEISATGPRAEIVIDGSASAEVLWKGQHATDSMFRFTSIAKLEIANLTFAAVPIDGVAHHCQAALRFDAGAGWAGKYLLRNVTIDGYDGAPERSFNFTHGVWFSGPGGEDHAAGNNNDHCTFLNCEIAACSRYGVLIDHFQSKAHRFYGCIIRANQVGVYGWGSFMWFGGAVANHALSDFVIATPNSNDPIVISGVNSESSAHFLVTDDPPLVKSGKSSTASQPVLVQGVRFDTDSVAADDKDPDGVDVNWSVDFRWAGPLVLIGNRFGVAGPKKPATAQRTRIHHTASIPATQSLVSLGNTFATDAAGYEKGYSPYAGSIALEGPHAGGLLSVGNNQYVRDARPASRSVPDVWRRPDAAFSVESGSISGPLRLGQSASATFRKGSTSQSFPHAAVTAGSQVHVVFTQDPGAELRCVTPEAGLFAVQLSAAATRDASFRYVIVNGS